MSIDEKRVVRTLQELVRIPSHDNECWRISSYVAGEIRSLGIKPKVDRDGNITASIGKGPALILNAHMDTVGIENYPDALSGKLIDGRIYGRGSSDDKAGIAGMLEIMKVLNKEPPKKQVIFAFTVGEEEGSEDMDGAYKVVKKVRAKHAIIMEPSVYDNGSAKISIGCKGRFVYRIDVIGKSAHSGSPDRGINSIYLANELVRKLKSFPGKKMKLNGCGEVKSHLIVTEIHAKEGTNVIPGKCTITVDYRSLPGEKEKDIKKKISAICRSVLGKNFRISPHEIKNGYFNDDSRMVKICIDSVREAGLKPLTGFSSGWNDGQVFSSSRIKAFMIGPGTSHQAHKNPEYCEVGGLLAGTSSVLNIIRRWDSL